MGDLPYRFRFPAYTGKLNDDGTLDPDPTVGLPDGYIWVRTAFPGNVTESRASVPALNGVRADLANAPIWAGYNPGGYLCAYEIRLDVDGVNQYGAVLGSMGVPQAPSALQNQVTLAALLDVGLVRPSGAGFILTVQQNNGVWQQANIDVGALAPGTSGTVGLGIVEYDPYAGAASLIGRTTIAWSPTVYGISVSSFASIPLTPGNYPLAGVAVAYGTVEVTNATMAGYGAAIIDLRLWLDQENTSGYWIVNEAATIPAGVSGVIPNGIRVTPNGTLTVLGTLCITP